MTRQSLTNEQRKQLRQFHTTTRPTPSQKACQLWCLQQFKFKPSQSTVSFTLSDRFYKIDALSTPQLNRHRARDPTWPALERILFDWQQGVQSKRIIVSDDVLREQAAQIFIQLPEYSSCSMPSWSNGWLHGFQRRFGIKEYVQYGEAGSVPEQAADEMEDLQQLANTYPPRNVFNMD